MIFFETELCAGNRPPVIISHWRKPMSEAMIQNNARSKKWRRESESTSRTWSGAEPEHSDGNR